LIGRSPAMQQAFKQIALVAQSELSVLITGETGTGKELVAAAIHRHSQRSAAAYLPIAPVALNPELIESELFGHVKGAFTGASEDRAGLFERAEGGTILLDEIGDLPLGTQVKLLRVLEQGDYCRVGDVRPRRCNVRILAATNCDLQQAVREGRFREDLFYRLNGLHIRLPPLRERTEDLGLLCAYFLERIAYPGAAEAVGPEVLGALAGRAWPGNVRELKNAVEHAAIVARGRRLTIDDFPACIDAASLADAATVKATSGSRDRVTLETSGAATADQQLAASAAAEAVERAVVAYLRELVERPGDDAPKLYDTLLAAVEPALFQFVLRHTGGNRIRAAEMLGIHRSTLRERLRHYRIDD
jgi:two-component system nitrogen regulation response regulator GlnG